MKKPTKRIHNLDTNTVEDIEISDEEFTAYKANIAKAEAKEAEAEAKAAAKAAAEGKLAALGLTTDDLRALGL